MQPEVTNVTIKCKRCQELPVVWSCFYLNLCVSIYTVLIACVLFSDIRGGESHEGLYLFSATRTSSATLGKNKAEPEVNILFFCQLHYKPLRRHQLLCHCETIPLHVVYMCIHTSYMCYLVQNYEHVAF